MDLRPDVSAGSPDRFGFSWDQYPELLSDHEEQFRRWTGPLEPKYWLGKTFIDAGCGMGRNSYWPLKYGARFGVAIDVDDRTIAHARNALQEFSNIDIRRESVYEITEENMFDVAFSIGVIHHLEFPEVAINRMVRSVRPGGQVLVWVYGRENNRWLIWLFNPIRLHVLSKLPLSLVHALSLPLTAILWMYVRTRVSGSAYIRLLAKLRFPHLRAIVFDHMIPRISQYYTQDEAIKLLSSAGLTNVEAHWTNKMSWTVIGRKAV